MKTLRLITFATVISFFGLTACSKKSDDVTPAQTANATVGFQVKIDGKDYAPDYAYALASFPGANGYYAIYGLNSKTSDVVAIALPNTAGEGTYSLNTTNIGMLSFNNDNDEFSTVNGGNGTVTIAKKTATYMTGTFSFTAYDATGTTKRTLTAGSFNVSIR